MQFLARLFRPLFTPAVVVAALGGLIASDAWLVRTGQLDSALRYVVIHPVLLLLVLGLTLLSTLFHECGHAAACRYGGARPGVIGMGVYVVWPAFFTNVTDAYRLGRAGRIRTDLGGVYFNAIFVGRARSGLPGDRLPAAARGGSAGPPGDRAAAAAVTAVRRVLHPGRPDRRARPVPAHRARPAQPDPGPPGRSPGPGPQARGAGDPDRVGAGHGAAAHPGAGPRRSSTRPAWPRTFAVSLVDQAGDLAEQLRRADIPAALLSVISIILLVLPIAGLSYILLITGRSLVRSVLAVNRRRPVLWLPSVAATLLIAALWSRTGVCCRLPHRHPRPSAVGDVTAQRPSRRPGRAAHAPARRPAGRRPARPPGPTGRSCSRRSARTGSTRSTPRATRTTRTTPRPGTPSTGTRRRPGGPSTTWATRCSAGSRRAAA